MLDRIADLIARHEMIPPSSRLGLAVSGGADSVFLLHALRELAPRWNLQLSVVHIEHGIRGAASKEDAEFVRQLAASFGLPFHIHHADVLAVDDNQEQAARGIRQNFFAQLIASGVVDRIATGHTRNDQAETVLYRILRGSGLAGLCGILPVTKEGLVRPLLELDRAEIEAWLGARGIAWREDATNQDRAYARNRLRHEILPLLRETFNPRLDETLSNMAMVAQDEERYWEATLSDVSLVGRTPWSAADALVGLSDLREVDFVGDERVQGDPRGPGGPPHGFIGGTTAGPQILGIAQLNAAAPAVARRLVRKAIQAVKGDLRQIDFAHVERILKMAGSQEGHDRVQLPGLDVFRSFEWIRLAPAGANNGRARDFSFVLQAPGSVELPGSHARITLQVLEKTEITQPCATLVDELDWQRLHPLDGALPSLELRNWRPGDQYQPVGQSKEQKVKFLFQEARVPLWERGNWPIITYNGIIVWTRRFGAAAEFAAGPSARVVLRVEISSEAGI